jgi:hypothetical protein
MDDGGARGGGGGGTYHAHPVRAVGCHQEGAEYGERSSDRGRMPTYPRQYGRYRRMESVALVAYCTKVLRQHRLREATQ